MGNIACKVGDQLGVLFIKTTAPRVSSRQAWVCVCTVCREESVVTTRTLLSSINKGCRCNHRKHLTTKNRVDKPTLTHGQRHTATYGAWRSMKKRCTSIDRADFESYGGRGIEVCQRWEGSFEKFLEDMGPRPSKKHSLDRIDVNGGYDKSNCRWTTQEVQFNNKRNSRYVVFNGERKTISQFAKQFGFIPTTIHSRINRGWCVESALTTPVGAKEN